MNENTANAIEDNELANKLEAIASKLERYGSDIRSASESLREGTNRDRAIFEANEAIQDLTFDMDEYQKTLGWESLRERDEAMVAFLGISAILKEHSLSDHPIHSDKADFMARTLDKAIRAIDSYANNARLYS